jgi:hypothetical protein
VPEERLHTTTIDVRRDDRGAPTVSTDPEPEPIAHAGRPSLDELFADAQPVRSAADLAHDGIFADDEIDEFLTDLYAMRRSNLA